MFPLIIPIIALLIGMSLLLMGNGLLNTLLALRGTIEGYNDGLMGIIMSGYFLGFFIGTFLALPLIKRIGHIRAFAFCAAIISTVALLHSFFINPYIWIVLRILTGTLLVILYTIIESWLNEQTPTEQRGRIFSIYMIVNLGSLAIAQQLLHLDSPASFFLFALASMLITISLVPITWTRRTQPTVTNVTRLKFKQLFIISPVAVAGSAFSGLAMGGFWGMAAVYAKHLGLENNEVATFMTCAIIGGVLCQYPMGRYSDNHARRKILAIISTGASIAAILFAIASYMGPWILFAIAIYGGLSFTVYPVAVAHLIDHLDSENILAGVSALLLIHGIGAAFGPALAGQLMHLMGHQALPFYFFIIQFLLAMYIFRTLYLTAEERVEQPSHFVPMIRTTPTALNMLPEEHENNAEINS